MAATIHTEGPSAYEHQEEEDEEKEEKEEDEEDKEDEEDEELDVGEQGQGLRTATELPGERPSPS